MRQMLTCPVCPEDHQPVVYGDLDRHLETHTRAELLRHIDVLQRHNDEANAAITDLMGSPPTKWPLFVRTRSRQKFHFLSPEGWEFRIEDIGYSLAWQCRFVGQTSSYYSNAQHSVLVADLVPEEHRFAALFHEFSEPFMGDMSSPLKQLCPSYKRLQTQVEGKLFPKIGIAFPLHPCIKQADLIMLKAEHRQLMEGHEYVDEVMGHVPEWAGTIEPLGLQESYDLFMDRYQAWKP